MNPIPFVSQTFSIVMSDKTQKSIVETIGVLGANPPASQGNFNSAMYSKVGWNKSQSVGSYNDSRNNRN